ncbi:hypothetical protein YS40_128 [Thermus phage phiYS40]|uniref:hypothetical protein n=1 Tax=Thermus phage phiYS40 TaxID=407392 RepID=UPI0000E689F6|nr:hypothetical protein YS40_128 [Thermus phage phiYS40]ABJ91522.1 hypothetical protein YS40_128 [Thermus phage phiYS40]BAK53646.1 hypothetical protein YSP_128 [Thermus phage phiYS40]
MLAPFEFVKVKFAFEYFKNSKDEENNFSFKKILKEEKAKDFYKYLKGFISKYYQQTKNSEGDVVQDILKIHYTLITNTKNGTPKFEDLGVKNTSFVNKKSVLKFIEGSISQIYNEAFRNEKEITAIVIFIELGYLTRNLDKVFLEVEATLERKEVF